MPRPRKYTTDAERQIAYRQRRQSTAIAAAHNALPAAPGIANMAAKRRWDSLHTTALNALDLLHSEMQAYYEERSETWQDSERGEEYQARIETISEAIELLRGAE